MDVSINIKYDNMVELIRALKLKVFIYTSSFDEANFVIIENSSYPGFFAGLFSRKKLENEFSPNCEFDGTIYLTSKLDEDIFYIWTFVETNNLKKTDCQLCFNLDDNQTIVPIDVYNQLKHFKHNKTYKIKNNNNYI